MQILTETTRTKRTHTNSKPKMWLTDDSALKTGCFEN